MAMRTSVKAVSLIASVVKIRQIICCFGKFKHAPRLRDCHYDIEVTATLTVNCDIPPENTMDIFMFVSFFILFNLSNFEVHYFIREYEIMFSFVDHHIYNNQSYHLSARVIQFLDVQL